MPENDLLQQVVGPTVVGLVVQVLVTWALFAWGRWVPRRQGGSRLWRLAAWSPWISFALLMGGMVVSIALLVRAFSTVAAADPSHRARSLAMGISEAMSCTALFAVPAYAILLAGLVAFAIGSVRRPALPR